jgi:hypothetical protein
VTFTSTFSLNNAAATSDAAYKGVSRFWQLDLTPGQHWSYSKQENITDFSSFNYCLSETPSIPGFSVIATANGFHPAMLYSAAVRVLFLELSRF